MAEATRYATRAIVLGCGRSYDNNRPAQIPNPPTLMS